MLLAAALRSGAAYASDPSLACEAGKLKATASYSACRLKADATAALKSQTPDVSKCDGKFGAKFPAAEAKAGPMVCPSEGDATPVRTFVTSCDDALATALAGGTLPEDVSACNADLATCQAQVGRFCGNGTVDTGEECDGADLAGKTCASFGATDVTGLSCTSGCTLDLGGCSYSTVPSRFHDNGDLTATDLWTGRTWEQKTGTPGSFVDCNMAGTCTDPHDVNNDYHWTSSGSALDGAVRTNFLDILNDVAGGGAHCFAGHCDWRLPTVLELKGIVLEPEAVGTCSTSPCIDPTFPGQTGVGGYWTETSWSDDTAQAYYVRFDSGGGIFPASKLANRYARAIRAGL
jgi:hypothetical protein